MDVVPYLSAVILISTIATIMLALISYAAFKLRDKRKPKQDVDAPIFFHRFELDGSPRADVSALNGMDAEASLDAEGAHAEP